MPKSRMTRRADGRFQKSIVDEKSGKRVYFYGATEREVNRKVLDYERKRERGRTFAEVADEWWGTALEAISPTSVRGYRVAKEAAVDYFGDDYVTDILPRDISRYLAFLAAKKYAKSTVKNYKIVISRIFHYALMAGDITISPTVGVEIPRGLTQKRRTSASSEDEEIIKQSVDFWLLPYMALMTGMRKGELLALQWRDIDFEENLISVSKSLYYEGNAHIKEPKTESGIRTIPLLPALREELLKLKAKQSPRPDFFVSSGEASPLLQKKFRVMQKKYYAFTGISATLHQLRKSFATVAVKVGIEPKVLQSIMGHKNITTTYNIYADVRKDSIANAGEMLAKVL